MLGTSRNCRWVHLRSVIDRRKALAGHSVELEAVDGLDVVSRTRHVVPASGAGNAVQGRGALRGSSEKADESGSCALRSRVGQRGGVPLPWRPQSRAVGPHGIAPHGEVESRDERDIGPDESGARVTCKDVDEGRTTLGHVKPPHAPATMRAEVHVRPHFSMFTLSGVLVLTLGSGISTTL